MKSFEKNIKIIYGCAGSGKSTAAKIMSLGFKNVFQLDGNPAELDRPFLLDGVTADTDLIVVENIVAGLESWVGRFEDTFLTVNARSKQAQVFETPRILLVTDTTPDFKVFASPYLTRRVDLIKCERRPDLTIKVTPVDPTATLNLLAAQSA